MAKRGKNRRRKSKIMKWIVTVASVGAAAWFYHYGDAPWMAYGAAAVFGLFGIFACTSGEEPKQHGGQQIVSAPVRNPHTLVLKGLTWDRNEFCRGWLIRGKTGCGKTKSGILNIMFQVFTNEPGWGGVCIDEKGLFWETLCAMARHFKREQDLLLLQVRLGGSGGRLEAFCLLQSALRHPHPVLDLRKGGRGHGHFPRSENQQFVLQGTGRDPHRQSDGTARRSGVSRHDDQRARRAHEQRGRRIERAVHDLCLEVLREKLDSPRRVEVYNHFQENYTNIAPEQRDGVKGTISNYLKNYVPPDIAQVFCPAANSFEFADIDRGKIICIAMPQKYQTERRYISTFLKMLFYGHVLRRFDRPESRPA